MDWLVGLLRILLEKATPEIREKLVDLIKEWEEAALATPNKIDDILVWLVKTILLID